MIRIIWMMIILEHMSSLVSNQNYCPYVCLVVLLVGLWLQPKFITDHTFKLLLQMHLQYVFLDYQSLDFMLLRIIVIIVGVSLGQGNMTDDERADLRYWYKYVEDGKKINVRHYEGVRAKQFV